MPRKPGFLERFCIFAKQSLTNSELKYLHTNFVKIFKVVLSCDFACGENRYLSDFEVLEKTFGIPPRLFVGCRRLVLLSKFLHTNQHHVIALDLASDCKNNRAWTRAALQDAQLLGRKHQHFNINYVI